MAPSIRGLGMVTCAVGAAALGVSTVGLVGCLPAETVVGAPLEAIVTPRAVALDGEDVAAHDVVPTADGTLLVDGTAGSRDVLVLAPADGRSPELLGEGGEIGAVRAIATAGAVTLVVGETGVLGVERGSVFRVPIEPMLMAMEVRAMVAVPRASAPDVLDFLVATDGGLFLVRDETATPIRADGAALVVSHLAPRGSGAWAADAQGLVRIGLEGATPTLSRLARVGPIDALASDDEGRPWWVEGGALWSLTRDQRVIVRELPMSAGVAPVAIDAVPSEGELWIHGSDASGASRALFHFDGHVFREVRGAIDGMTLRCATGSECFGFDGTGEMARIAVRHGAVIEGLDEGATVHEPVTVSVTAEASDRVAAMRASVGDVTIPVEDGALTIDPSAVGFGARELRVTVEWSDGTLSRTVRRGFVAQPPATWTDDIEPLYRAQCADCHGPAGPSARRLDAREGWMREIDRLLPAIEGGAMPLGRPRLPETTVALVRTWAAAGFP